MGNFAPEPGVKHRMVVELKGSKALTQGQYEKYKKAIMEIAKAYGAEVVMGEYVIIKKKGPR